MKLYFEDGMLKFYMGEEATEQRRAFLHDIFHIFREWDAGNTYTQIVKVESQYKYMIKAAQRHGIEITQDVEDYYQYSLRKEEEERQRKAKMESQKKAIEKADFKQKNGCGWCDYLEYVGGRHVCEYAKRACRYRQFDEEYAFEIRKEVKAFGKPIVDDKIFIAPPYPCAGCIYLEEAVKAWEEINKEKEGNV